MRYILALIVIFAAHGAYANCGPTLEIGPEFSITDDTGGLYPGITTDASIGITLEIPIGKSRDIACEELKAKARKYNAEAADEAADAMDQRIRNFDRIVSICEKKWIESLCSRLEELGAEIGTQ